jgi:hypothetical protein
MLRCTLIFFSSIWRMQIIWGAHFQMCLTHISVEKALFTPNGLLVTGILLLPETMKCGIGTSGTECLKWSVVDQLRRNPHWWYPIISSAYGVSPTNQSVYAVSGTSRCLFSDKYKTHKHTVGRAYSCWMLNCWCITWPVVFKRVITTLLSKPGSSTLYIP